MLLHFPLHIYFITDSMITLSWTKLPHKKMNSLVSKRMLKIRNTYLPHIGYAFIEKKILLIVPREIWTLASLINHFIWFSGPKWRILCQIATKVEDPLSLDQFEYLPENLVLITKPSILLYRSIDYFYSMPKLLRSIANWLLPPKIIAYGTQPITFHSETKLLDFLFLTLWHNSLRNMKM